MAECAHECPPPVRRRRRAALAALRPARSCSPPARRRRPGDTAHRVPPSELLGLGAVRSAGHRAGAVAPPLPPPDGGADHPARNSTPTPSRHLRADADHLRTGGPAGATARAGDPEPETTSGADPHRRRPRAPATPPQRRPGQRRQGGRHRSRPQRRERREPGHHQRAGRRRVRRRPSPATPPAPRPTPATPSTSSPGPSRTTCRPMLEAKGITVIMTRDSDDGVGPCVNKRAAIGNDAERRRGGVHPR